MPQCQEFPTALSVHERRWELLTLAWLTAAVVHVTSGRKLLFMVSYMYQTLSGHMPGHTMPLQERLANLFMALAGALVYMAPAYLSSRSHGQHALA